MNYEQLINTFATQNDIEYAEAAEFIDSFFAVIKLGVARGEPVKIFKFGTFSQKTIKTKLSRNKKNNKIEITPDGIYPNFEYTRIKENGKKALKNKKAVKSPADTLPKSPSDLARFVEMYYKKVVIIFVSLLIIFFLTFLAGFKYFKNKVMPAYLEEEGLTHPAIEEMVESRFQDVIIKTEEYSKELSAVFSNQVEKLKDKQKTLQKKITAMIRPQLKKNRKRAQVKMVIYKVKKNDTLWKISRRYLKNPYNWVGLYHTNGKKIKDPNKIFPGQKIFIPVIKEY